MLEQQIVEIFILAKHRGEALLAGIHKNGMIERINQPEGFYMNDLSENNADTCHYPKRNILIDQNFHRSNQSSSYYRTLLPHGGKFQSDDQILPGEFGEIL